jgi:hypothetical protein
LVDWTDSHLILPPLVVPMARMSTFQIFRFSEDHPRLGVINTHGRLHDEIEELRARIAEC